jgi:hypothetical protein
MNQRPIMQALPQFGKLLRIVYTAGGEREIIIEIAPLLNKSGVDKELPNDLSQWLREAISRIGYPLRSYEAVPSSILVRPIYLPGPDRPQRPPLTFRVTGVLERFFERQIQGKDLEFYLRVGDGKTSGDGQFKRTMRATLTRVTVSLTLEQPDGLDLATATYFVDIVKTEFDKSWGLFLGGTGFGGGRNLMVAGDPGDSIFDASGAALMTIIGRAPETLAPYYRCSSSIFPEDDVLNELERHALNRMTENELLGQIKPYLYLSNIANMDMTTRVVTPADREQIAAQMRSHHLDPSNRNALASFVYMLWHDIPIEQAADRLEKRIEEVVVIRKTRAEAEAKAREEQEAEAAEAKARAAEAKAREEEAWNINPSKFRWPPETRMVLLDVSNLIGPARTRLIRALRVSYACQQVKTDPARNVIAVRMRPTPHVAIGAHAVENHDRVLRALARAQLRLEYRWVGEQFKRLCVIPE